MRGIKMPQQYFALKRQGGLCARGGGGIFAGHYGINIMAYFYAVCAVTCYYFQYWQEIPPVLNLHSYILLLNSPVLMRPW